MPTSALRPCAHPGCRRLVVRGRCRAHQPQERARRNVDVRRFYRTVRWFRLRADVIRAANYSCAQCGAVTLSLEVDHVIDHRGDQRLFWHRQNLQALCASCHARKTRRTT